MATSNDYTVAVTRHIANSLSKRSESMVKSTNARAGRVEGVQNTDVPQ